MVQMLKYCIVYICQLLTSAGVPRILRFMDNRIIFSVSIEGRRGGPTCTCVCIQCTCVHVLHEQVYPQNHIYFGQISKASIFPLNTCISKVN